MASSASSPGRSTTWATTSVLEREPLERLAGDGPAPRPIRHTGFWECMDTYKDAVLLNDLWSRGEAPWKAVVSERAAEGTAPPRANQSP